RRFFTNKIAENKAVIRGNDYNHIINVLRLKQGDTVNVFNYEHGEFSGTISAVDALSREVTVTVSGLVRAVEKNTVKISAAVAVIKNENMDLIMEKLTEIGVDRIIPVITRRCVVKADEPEKKAARWQKIIYSAVKQCGRLTMPELMPLVRGAEALGKSETRGTRLLLWEKEQEVFLIDEAVKGAAENSILFFAGPEGGFEDDEAGALIVSGFKPVSLGPSTLRAETAVITAAGVISQAQRRIKWKT
ncbi:MAG TPA: RsmE family RNA methyltransferase, partial [Candidatus Goldiibacteriota bacterium]|nr:RsmE family RNA methyltransferase [Candidatus Goldiibacteriota bacterium]